MNRYVILFIISFSVFSGTVYGQNQISVESNKGKIRVFDLNEDVVVQFVTSERPQWYYKTPLLYRKVAKDKNVTFVTGKLVEIGVNDILVETSRKDKFRISSSKIIAVGKASKVSKMMTSTIGVVLSCNGSLAVMAQTGFFLGAGAFVAGVGVVGLANKAIFPVVRVNEFSKKWKLKIQPVLKEDIANKTLIDRSLCNKGV